MASLSLLGLHSYEPLPPPPLASWPRIKRKMSTLTELFLPAFVTICCILASLLLFIYKCRSRKTPKTFLLFIDGPDPDNPACALALWNHLVASQPSPHLHIVLTGRPVDLRTKKQFKTDTPIREQIPRQDWEQTNSVHACKLLSDSAARISNYLISCGLSPSSFTIYNGGIASYAPISDVAHDWEFLYDRTDLITGISSDAGNIISGEEYASLVQKYNSLTDDDREKTLMSLLRNCKMVPLSQLRVTLQQDDHMELSVFLGGPATAVVHLFEGDQNNSIRTKVVELFAMFGALMPEKSTLLGNQFNAACDMESAAQLFMENMFPNVPMYIIPTETAKLPELIVSAGELESRGAHSYAVSLIKLWESTHSDRPQPVFDVLPVMAAIPQFKKAFIWRKKKVVIQDWIKDGQVRQKFIFTDTDHGLIYVSDGTFNLSRECFLQFLDYCFRA